MPVSAVADKEHESKQTVANKNKVAPILFKRLPLSASRYEWNTKVRKLTICEG